MPKVFNVMYLQTCSPYQVHDKAGWPLAEAARLCASGICKPATDDDAELLAAIAAYRSPKPQEWQRYLLQPSWFRFNR